MIPFIILIDTYPDPNMSSSLTLRASSTTCCNFGTSLELPAKTAHLVGLCRTILGGLLIQSFTVGLPSGKHTKSYWTWPFLVDLPIKNGDFPLIFHSFLYVYQRVFQKDQLHLRVPRQAAELKASKAKNVRLTSMAKPLGSLAGDVQIISVVEVIEKKYQGWEHGKNSRIIF